ncbi:prolipoprotein diacylglyceryl transferase [Chloroflexota bacterium]
MIDPVLFSFDLFGIHFAVHWYGVLVGIGTIVGGMLADREIQRRGGPEGYVWDLMLWLVPAGIVGARLGYVLNDLAGGSPYFSNDPVRILRITDGGLHIYGALVLGLVAAYYYTKRHPLDMRLLLDSVGPPLLIGQAIGRFANFINQELYGPPTDRPWGVTIAGENRIFPWTDLEKYPEETTRFHPTFFYEIIWNMLAAGAILWAVRKWPDKFKPGAAFYLYLIMEGVGRFFIEFFRPDQPRLGGTDISYSRIAATLMALFGGVMMLVRYKKLELSFLSAGSEKYRIRRKKKGRR